MSIGTLPATGPRPTAEPLPEVEREARQDRIRRHIGQFAEAAAAMRRFGRDVTGWTLPASWDPGPAPDPFVASTYESAARRDVEARLLGRPLTFTGDRIVVHLDPAGPGEPDRLERKP